MALPSNLYVGTSSWSSNDWVGPFYPAGLKPGDFIEFYSRKFRAVEIDSTFYRIPSRGSVAGWKEKTPAGFVFAAKIPQIITHEKVLRDCEKDLSEFLKTMDLLGDRLGPLLFQFPYFNRSKFASREQFDRILRPFLKALPSGYKFALEIRNKNWITWDFLEMLREHSVAFALVAQLWMPRIDVLAKALDVVTADFCYVRFIGDRKGIEAKTQKWDKLIEDKTGEMKVWIEELKKIVNKKVLTYAFFNNHYAGYAPGSISLFEQIWQANK